MNKQIYIESRREQIRFILSERRFYNFKSQMFAKKLGAEFKESFNEKYLWSSILSLSTNAVMLLSEDSKDKDALHALKMCAETYEIFSEISEKYDKDYCAILSALCYDISGYQANALCMVKNIEQYSLTTDIENFDLKFDNFIFAQIQDFLLKKIPNAYKLLEEFKQNKDNLEFIQGMRKLETNILYGSEGDYSKGLRSSYEFFLKNGNVYLSHLLFLFLARIKKYEDRAIQHILQEKIKKSEKWKNYIKLLSNDLYEDNQFKDINSRKSKFEFWISQLYAIEKGILDSNESQIIQMPTSTGKTFIAELTILNTLINKKGSKCIYIAPYRSLSNQVEIDLNKNLSKLGFNVSMLAGSYDTDEYQDLIIEDTDVLVATPEKIDLLYRVRPELFEKVTLLVVDEGHLIGDRDSRASLLELLITRLKMKIKNLQIIFLSAVMSIENAKEFSLWLANKSNNVIQSPKYISEEIWEPTRKIFGLFSWGSNKGRIDYPFLDSGEGVKTFVPNFIEVEDFIDPKSRRIKKFPDCGNKGETACSLAYKLSQRGNCLIYCSKPNWVISVGKKFLKLISLYDRFNPNDLNENFIRDMDKESVYFASKWYGKDSVIVDCLSRGIGLHFGYMPEAVKKSIEKDYSEGHLKVLIATKTVGQGINFPIKNLIIHSVTYGKGSNEMSVRDFWNLAGRAGRAGEETEGQIIFLQNNPRDLIRFNNYANRENMEKCESVFSLLLRSFHQNGIDQEKLQNYLDSFAESYILNVLYEDIGEQLDQSRMNNILKHSLFEVQTKDLDKTPIEDGFRKLFYKIEKNINDIDMGRLFSRTGFSVYSNKKIFGYINQNEASLKKVIEDDNLLQFLYHVLDSFKEKDVLEMNSDFNLDENNQLKICELLVSWVNGVEIEQLISYWTLNDLGNDIEFYKFINGMLTYRLPWGLNVFLDIVLYCFKIEKEDLPQQIRNVQSFVKFGVNNEFSALLMNLGFKNRETSLIVSKQYDGEGFKSFISWIRNINEEDLKLWGIDNKYDIENIMQTLTRLTNKDYFSKKQKKYTFKIRGIFYDEKSRKVSKRLEIGTEISLKREYKNIHDPYAIAIYFSDTKLGYMPRELAKYFSLQMDLSNKKYHVKIISTKENDRYRDIYVELL